MPPKKSSAGAKKDALAPPPASASKSGAGKGKGSTASGTPDSGRSTPVKQGGGGGGGSSGGSGSGGKQGKQQQQQQSNDNAPPAGPTVKQIIGGPSWTGKLPVNLLAEHCQKNGWDGRPDYNSRRFPDGFLGSVTVRCKNPKTSEVEEVVFTPPREIKSATGEVIKLHQPTQLEAKHMLATYVLNRVANMINIKFMLPPSHQDFWKIFEENRKHDLKEGKSWMYEADPFQAQRERKALMEKVEKERLAKVAAAEASAANGGGSMIYGGSGGWNERMKGWKGVPNAEMTKDMRVAVEDLIRKHYVWNPAGIMMSREMRERTFEELTNLGFRKRHVEEGCDWAADKEECLDWLLVHVPEDDLPPRFLPDKYTVGVSITAGNIPLAQEYAAKRLSSAGYSLEVCHASLQQHDGNELIAAEHIQNILLNRPFSSESDLLDFEEGDPWEEEQSMNEAIWPPSDPEDTDAPEPKFSRITPAVSKILIEPDLSPAANIRSFMPQKIWLHVQKPVANYPISAIPVITIHTEAPFRLPAHIRLSIIRNAANYAYESLLGAQMTFSIVDWLESNIVRIIRDPGRLRDVSSAITQLEKKPADTDLPHKATKRTKAKRPAVKFTPSSPASIALQKAWLSKHSEPTMKRLMWARQNLPAWNKREQIITAVKESQVTIITGETGSGKSTQSVQYILDDLIERQLGEYCNIVCTQPRRISALGLASRVAEERCTSVGQEVGYVIRGDSKSRRGVTKITFVTTGVLLRRMQMAGGGEDGEDEDAWGGLEGVSHVFVDEVHERSLDTDFLLVLLKRALAVRKDLKVVLMSATVDAETFAEYFKRDGLSVDMVEIEGRTFPVQDFYLEDVVKQTEFELFTGPPKGANESGVDGITDPYVSATIRAMGDRINYALITQTVQHIDRSLGRQEGGILIFLPGTMEIKRTFDAIQRLPSSSQRYHTLPLHASLTPRDQQAVFPPAPGGKRKVVCATNVAETSITIPDIVAVIDTGRVKETSYAPESDMVRLLETWASKAACKQRKGRAGRVRPGNCYKLFTRAVEAQKMSERPEPEMRRVPLQQTCLGVKAMGVKDVRSFLASAVTPPDTGAVDGAMLILEKMGALREEGLTALGRHMSMIPADLKCSKLLVYGCIFGCLDMTLTIAGILSTKSPFVSPMDKRKESKAAKMRFGGPNGDLLADALAYLNWASLRQSMSTTNLKFWCEDNFLSHHAMLDIASNKSQLLASLKESGLIPVDYELPVPTDLVNNLGSQPSQSRAQSQSQLQPQQQQSAPPRPKSPEEEFLINLFPTESPPPPPPPPAASPSLTEATETLTSQDKNLTLLRALIGASFTPQVARIQMPDKKYKEVSSGTVEVDPEARMVKYFTGGTAGSGRVFIHPASTLFDAKGFIGAAGFVAYWLRMSVGRKEDLAGAKKIAKAGGEGQQGGQGEKVSIRELTPVGTYALLMLGGELRVDLLGRGMTVDGWLRVRGWGRIGVLVGMMRRLVEGVLRDRFVDGLGSGSSGAGVGGEENGEVAERKRNQREKEKEVVFVVRKLIEGEGQ